MWSEIGESSVLCKSNASSALTILKEWNWKHKQVCNTTDKVKQTNRISPLSTNTMKWEVTRKVVKKNVTKCEHSKWKNVNKSFDGARGAVLPTPMTESRGMGVTERNTGSLHTNSKQLSSKIMYGQQEWNFLCWFGQWITAIPHPLWPNDAIWQHRSGSTLAQTMACCLAALSHYLNQCWQPG